MLFLSLRPPVRRLQKYIEAGKKGGMRLCVSLRGWVRRDVTGIAIPNYAMFLFFFFQCEVSRLARREFSHAPEVPNAATIAAFLDTRALFRQYMKPHKRFDLEAVPSSDRISEAA